MVLFAPLIGAAVFLSGFAAALPTSDYSSGSSNSYGGSSSSNSNYGSSSGNSYGGSSDSSKSNYGSSNSNSYGGSSGSSNSNYGGSSNSNYGGSGNSYGGSSNSNYGGSSSSDYGNSGYDNSKDTTSSSMMMETSSTTMMEETSSTTMMMETSSTTMMMETSTTSAMNSYETSSYGSGSTYWGGSGYQDCVNQCIAQFPPSGGDSSSGGGMGGSYQATATSGSEGSKGTGSTHTVIVAPTKGVFRMMPFATNASVGDTIEFHWGADGHTVTQSSELTPCNKSGSATAFASGTQNQSFVFTQVVNDTNPTFYFCATPGHCDKGMFGIINPKMATPGAPTSLGGMMSSMAANDSNLAAYAAYTLNVTASNNQAATWGSNFDMASLPEWSHSLLATNVMYTRAALAMNSEVLQADNSVDLSSVAGTPLMLPMDLTSALNAASAPATTDVGTAGAAGAAATAPAGAAESSPAAANTGAASLIASPRLLVGAVVVLATIFAL